MVCIQSVRPDLGPNCLQWLSADNTKIEASKKKVCNIYWIRRTGLFNELF